LLNRAAEGLDSVEHVLVVRRTGQDVPWAEGRDVWWHDLVDSQPDVHAAETFDAEQPLFIIRPRWQRGDRERSSLIRASAKRARPASTTRSPGRRSSRS